PRGRRLVRWSVPDPGRQDRRPALPRPERPRVPDDAGAIRCPYPRDRPTAEDRLALVVLRAPRERDRRGRPNVDRNPGNAVRDLGPPLTFRRELDEPPSGGTG